MNKNIFLKYRTWFKGIPPRPIKLEIPGWSGENQKRKTGNIPQPWHCLPFIEGSTYGLELIYPFDTECKVINNNGKVEFIADFAQENGWNKPEPPFSNFSPFHYGFTSSLDLNFSQDLVLRIEPHPRFFTDVTNTVPLAVPGHIQQWWSRIFFVVFKSPSIGQCHIFKKNEPYAQILLVPKDIQYDISLMNIQEAAWRDARDAAIIAMGSKLEGWRDHLNHKFDDKYKQLNNIYKKEGEDGVDAFLNTMKYCKVKTTKTKVPTIIPEVITNLPKPKLPLKFFKKINKPNFYKVKSD